MIDLLSLSPSPEAAPPVSLGSSVPLPSDFSVQFDDLLQSLSAGISEDRSLATLDETPVLPQLAKNDEPVLLPPGEGPLEILAGVLANRTEASVPNYRNPVVIHQDKPEDIPPAETSNESGQSVDHLPEPNATLPRVPVEQPKLTETNDRTPDAHRQVRRPLPKPNIAPTAESSDSGEAPMPTTSPAVAIALGVEKEPRPDEVAEEPHLRKPVGVQRPDGRKQKPLVEDEIVKAWTPPLLSLPFATLQVGNETPQPVNVSPEPVTAPLPKSLPGFQVTTSASATPNAPNAARDPQAKPQASAKAVLETDATPKASSLVAPPLRDESATSGLAAEFQQALLEDVKRFEVETRHEPARILETQTAEPASAVITTDPIANLRQLQLPPRVLAIQKITLDPRSADRPKTEQGAAAERSDTGTPVQTLQAMESRHAAANIDQLLPAQPIEIPDIPKLKFVRTVSMEVGEAESQVTIRIEARGGDMNLHLGVGNETLHHELESSMGSLIHTLKQEDIQVSTAEVSRKSPIEKVRRMKEANNGHH